ncbi:hypothetical protein FOMPIDRAFT_1058987 [Fomitopsis schrenkii]|uniref:Uncharacterized protein n=1 Tax=Fomitopsis schrenkii TaxID=2126942 RepID=S8EET4_FOMSC|nr:hypothetical protein FOMPIDRAFT_1058987 [Fomitopsis schrenkii]
MGSAQSHVTEVVAATVVLASAAAVYSYKPSSSQSRTEPEPELGSESAFADGKKNKRKRKAGGEHITPAAAEKSAAEPTVVQFPPVVPGDFDASSAPAGAEPTPDPAPKSTKSKKKKAKKAGTATSRPVDAMSDSSATAPESSAAAPVRPSGKQRKASTPKPAPAVAPVDTDGSWTRVEAKQKKTPQEATPLDAGTSDAGVTTTSVTGTSSPAVPGSDAEETDDVQASTSDNRRTFAERMLPKPRKTGVDDMLETPDYPTVARVMRIRPGPDDQPAAGFSWADYEDVDDSQKTADDADGEDDGGWGVVKGKGRTKTQKPATVPTAPDALSKKQRQNAAKKEAQKAAKADAEAERQARLAQHKRELERAKIAEQYNKPAKGMSGGMTAYVDENGKLVWK